MKKILFITMCAPYDSVPHAGGQTVNYYIKKIAQEKDFQVDLVSYCSADFDYIDELETAGIHTHFILRSNNTINYIRNILSINSKINPFYKYCNLMTWNASNLLLMKLKKLKSDGYDPDIIIMEWTQIVLQVADIKKIFPDAKYIASEHDVTFLGVERRYNSENNRFLKLYKRVQWNNTRKRELAALQKCNAVVAHNSKDKILLEKEQLRNLYEIVPYFHSSKVKYRQQNNDILFFGYMKRNENKGAARWFIDNVMPLIEDLDCRFVIIGGGIDDEIKSWESDRIIVTGYVDSTDCYFSKSMCFVSPLILGAGIKVKVIEALDSGITVLTNSIGIEGIPAVANKDYYHCEMPQDYERIIRGLINKDVKPLNGRLFIEEHFSLETSFYNYNKLIRGL